MLVPPYVGGQGISTLCLNCRVLSRSKIQTWRICACVAGKEQNRSRGTYMEAHGIVKGAMTGRR